ncbi:MAG: replication-associated recombination protein A [Myxococcota bacterium]|nr:replication-associated recombination protein A [Myxococcota bacterium]
MDLFEHADARDQRHRPLADIVRPKSLADFFGHDDVVGARSALRRALSADRLFSLILWGPPGVGKTTLAHLIADHSQHTFVSLSAIGTGVKTLRNALDEARERRRVYGRQTIIFIDEIHRFNKAQQDALLPDVERGVITLIGATTENPNFEVNAALLSRARVVRLNPLTSSQVFGALHRAWHHPYRQDNWPDAECMEGALEALASAVNGDVRRALNALESALNDGRPLSVDLMAAQLNRSTLLHDRNGDDHYAVVSALIKSMRLSDPDAAAYWTMRMIEAGEDPTFIARRLVIFASEDVGHADPESLQIAVAAAHAARLVGLPEAIYPLVQAATHLATAPKSRTIPNTIGRARAAVESMGALPVPAHLRPHQLSMPDPRGKLDGSPVKLSTPGLPEALLGHRFFEPIDSGREAQFKARLAFLNSAMTTTTDD